MKGITLMAFLNGNDGYPLMAIMAARSKSSKSITRIDRKLEIASKVALPMTKILLKIF